MPLSSLQKFILSEVYGAKGKMLASRFLRFYRDQETHNYASLRKSKRVKIVDKSVNRLINKGLLVGWGEKTQYKWFIKEVQLTSLGRKSAKRLQGEQARLPFKK